MANIVQNTICKMLRNLKDGQVYVSVDEVHQYLKKTGNVITKEKIQGTKCSLEYEKVNHGAKNNRDGPAKVKTYYKLVDVAWKKLPETRAIPILRYNSLQLHQESSKKAKAKRKSGQEIPARVKQRLRFSDRKKTIIKTERLLANKMAQLQRLYVANNGAAPSSLLQPERLYQSQSVPLPPSSFRYAEKILHYIFHGVRGPALAHIIGTLTAKEEATSAEGTKMTAEDVKLMPEHAEPLHPPIKNPNTSFHRSLVLGLGLISCPKQTVSNDAYVCILASDMVMKIRKRRYMSPMQQLIGSCLYANNCRPAVLKSLHSLNITGTRKTIKNFATKKSVYNENSNINILGNEIGEDKVAIFAYDNLEFKSKSGSLTHYVTIVRLAIPKSRFAKNPPELQRVALTHANVVGNLLNIPKKLLQIGVNSVQELGKQLQEIKDNGVLEPVSVLMQNTMSNEERGALVDHHDEVLDISPATHILKANDAEVFAMLKMNLGNAETVRTVMNIINDFTPTGQSRYMVGDGAPTYLANVEQQSLLTTPASIINNVQPGDTKDLVVVAGETKSLGLKVDQVCYKSRGLMEVLKVVGYDASNHQNHNAIQARLNIDIGDVFYKINETIVATASLDVLVNLINNTTAPFTVTFIKSSAVPRIGAAYDKALLCQQNNLNIALNVPFRIIPGLWHAKFKLLQNIQDEYGSLFLVEILKKYGRSTDGKIMWVLKPGKPRDAFTEMRMVLLGLQQAVINASKGLQQDGVITEDIYLLHIHKRAKEMPIVACVWEWMFQFKLIMHFEEAVRNGDIHTIMQLLKTLLLNCAASNSYKYIYFLLLMFRDRLQMGPEEKQIIDRLAFLARTVNGVRMEMDLFVENVQLLFRNTQGKTERLNTYEMLCMQGSLMDEMNAMRSSSQRSRAIPNIEYRVQLQLYTVVQLIGKLEISEV